MIFIKSVSIYALVVGVLMMGMWVFFIVAGLVPEFDERPAEIVLHLTAEFATSGMLIVGAIMMLKKRTAGAVLMLWALGMLVYTLIVSPGYYVQQGDAAFVVMFGILLVVTICLLVLHTARMIRFLKK